MAFQHWHCECCREEGTVQHKKDAGVHEVKEMIGSQHRKYAAYCADVYGIDKVRLGFPTRDEHA